MPLSKDVVLVVEDDPQLRRMYHDALTLVGGFVVVAVEDGMDALHHLEATSSTAAVVLDLGLSRVSGHDVVHELMAHPRTAAVPVIVVTGNPAGIDRSSVACVLTKPINVDDLIASVKKCLRSRAEQRVGDIGGDVRLHPVRLPALVPTHSDSRATREGRADDRPPVTTL